MVIEIKDAGNEVKEIDKGQIINNLEWHVRKFGLHPGRNF